jgi:hypothetical protein
VRRLPVAADLQHRRAGQAAVGEQQVFEEGHALFLAAGADFHGQGQAGQLGIGLPGRAVKGQRHQAGTALDQRQLNCWARR